MALRVHFPSLILRAATLVFQASRSLVHCAISSLSFAIIVNVRDENLWLVRSEATCFTASSVWLSLPTSLMTASTSPATRGILLQNVYKVEADLTARPARPIKPAILDARSISGQGKESSRMQTLWLKRYGYFALLWRGINGSKLSRPLSEPIRTKYPHSPIKPLAH